MLFRSRQIKRAMPPVAATLPSTKASDGIVARIVKPGVIRVPVTPWQETTLFRCANCGCEWYAGPMEWHEIEPTFVTWHGDAGCAGMDCPTCGRHCQIREPGKPIARGVAPLVIE